MNKENVEGLKRVFQKAQQVAAQEHRERLETTNRDKWVEDFCSWFRGISLSDEQAAKIYDVVSAKLRHAVCGRCLRSKPRRHGIIAHATSDLSKPKVFVCEDCK